MLKSCETILDWCIVFFLNTYSYNRTNAINTTIHIYLARYLQNQYVCLVRKSKVSITELVVFYWMKWHRS